MENQIIEKFYNGYTHKQIAEVLNVPYHTVRNVVNKYLRENLNR